jgi:hypothetical protein
MPNVKLDGNYKQREIKFGIDNAIQKAMWDYRDDSNKEQIYNSLVNAQSRLYEEFNIDD